MVEATAKGIEPLSRLPKPFDTIIPNAAKIAESAEIEGGMPASFRQKYSPEGKFEAFICTV